ncbi:MAG: protein kinase [Planctomycetes bacterium]|nr:protein kinase [Planctomycetota bacterium]
MGDTPRRASPSAIIKKNLREGGTVVDFGHLLVERGLITSKELDEALAVQRRYIVEGREPLPRLGEILIERGSVSEQEVADALGAQRKKILYCSTCKIQVNVEERADVAGYQCVRCGGEMQAPEEVNDVRVIDTSVIFIAKDPVPKEVEAAAADPARKMGKYILLEEIGRGGAAIVHRAWDTYLHQYVALKFLKPPPESTDPHAKARQESMLLDLLKEARHAIRLRHPNIVTTYDVGRIDKLFYIAMDYLNGQSLLHLIRQSKEKGGVSPFYDDPGRFVILLRDLCRAVHYAHTRQVPLIHCDLKPSNVIIDTNWRPYILDFGLARELVAERPGQEEAVVRGTPSYMAPEQASGQPELIDARTDVYGLGTILYELLVGRAPFTGGSALDVLTKVVHTTPEPPSSMLIRVAHPEGLGIRRVTVPPSLERICLKCLEKFPANRFPSANALADELERVLMSEAHTVRFDALPFIAEGMAEPAAVAAAVKPSPARRLAPAWFLLGAGLASAVILAFLSLRPGASNVEGLRVQLDHLSRKFDEQVAAFQVELARGGLDEVGAVLAQEIREDDWVDRQIESVEWVRTMKARLIAALNRKPGYRVRDFRLRDQTLRDVEIVHADERRVVAVRGERTNDIPWSAIEPEQLTDMIRTALGSANPADRLGLAIYCIKTRQRSEAEELLRSLNGTDLEIPSRAYLKELRDK